MTQSKSPARAFAAAAASLVEHDDVADTLSRLLLSCADVLRMDAVALMVKDASGDLQLLTSTSHAVTELELYQIQCESGPCVEAIATGHGVSASPGSLIAERWPDVGPGIAASGFESVHAAPLRWHGEPLGGLNLFDRSPGRMQGDDLVLAQAFADIATIVIVRSGRVDVAEAALQIRRALEGRTVIERAKGVLAYTLGVDMGTAFERLLRLSDESDATLSETAAVVIRDAQRQPRG
jgi:GAF domain-containing protein